MITAIYFRDRVIEPYGHVGDIFVIGDKKYRVINQKNPNYGRYYVEGDRPVKYFWGFEEVEDLKKCREYVDMLIADKETANDTKVHRV